MNRRNHHRRRTAMKKLALLLALAFAAPAFAEPAMLPSHAVQDLALGINPGIQIELLAVSVTTTTAGTYGAIISVAGDGTEDAPTGATTGLSLADVASVQVVLKTASNATAGGKLLCYFYDEVSETWSQLTSWDLTAAAATNQTWEPKVITQRRGRIFWVPNGIGAVVTSIYIIPTFR
jgi:hypothetical protein